MTGTTLSNSPPSDARAPGNLLVVAGATRFKATKVARRAPTWLLVCVLAVHLIGLEWMVRQASGLNLLQTMAEPDFQQSLTPTDLRGTDAAVNPPAAQMPPASTVGQVIQARTVLPDIATNHAPTPSSQLQPSKQKPPPLISKPRADLHVPEAHRQEATTDNTAQPSTHQPDDPASDKATSAAHSELHSAPAEHTQSPANPLDTPPLAASNQLPPPGQSVIANQLPDSADASVWLANWPRNTRLNYQLKGYYRGDFFGHARVQWQRSDQRYQTQIHVNVGLLVDMRMTSQGRITPTRLWPEAYEEERRGKKRGARFGDQLVTLDGGGTLNRVPHLQDTASQFVQLAQDFATGRIPLRVNAVVPVTLGRPGGVDDWLYDVLSQEPVSTGMGEVTAYHLKPRPLANPRGTVSAEIWFAPALQHMPVRIRLTLNPETWLDLTLDSAQTSE